MRLLILSAKTGGGHEMRARALTELASSLGFETHTIRPLEEGSIIDRFGSNLYNWIQKFYPRLHRFYFGFLEFASLHRKTCTILSEKKMRQEVTGFSPDLVISVHAHLNHGFRDLIIEELEGDAKPKFVVYCGELADGIGYSRHWINPMVDEFWGPFSDCIGAAIKKGMPKSKCHVMGPLLRSHFYEMPADTQVKEFILKYDFSLDDDIVLLGTGANGVQNHIKASKSLLNNSFRGQIAALCSSKRIKSQLTQMAQHSGLMIKPLSILDSREMSILTYMSSWIYGRPGAGLTTESLVANKPMIFDINGGLMPQEENNLNFWRENCQSLTIARRPEELGLLSDKILPPFRNRKQFSPRKILDRLSLLRKERYGG